VVNGGAFYGHTGTASDKAALYLSIGCGCLDDRGANPRATAYADSFSFAEVGQGFCPGTNADPLSWRVFFIDYKGSRVRSTATVGHAFLANRTHFINCVLRIRRTWNGSTPDPWFRQADTLGVHFTNCIFELVSEHSDFSILFSPSSGSVIGPRLMNCALIFRGTSDGTSSPHLYLNLSSLRDKLRLGNTLLIADSVYAPGAPTSGYPAQIALSRTSGTNYPLNGTDSLRYLAVAGCVVADSSPHVGFGNATGLVNLGTENNTFSAFTRPTGRGNSDHVGYSMHDVDEDSPLYAAGNTNPFADKGDCLPAPTYDFYGRPRPSTPSIGPFDALTLPASGGGGGGGGGGSGSRAIVYSPARSAT
jgi:hypothetical protein